MAALQRDPIKKSAPIISLSEIEVLHEGINLLTDIPYESAKPLVTGNLHEDHIPADYFDRWALDCWSNYAAKTVVSAVSMVAKPI